MKKVLVAALVCAVSSFAAWDYFPVIGDGKGEFKIGAFSSRQGSDGGVDLDGIKVRYSPMANLELMSKWLGLDGSGLASEFEYPKHIIGARYQIIPVLSAGVDIGFPIPATNWAFSPNVQFSMNITNAISFGSNVQLDIYTENKEKFAHGMDLGAGIELDFAMGQSIIWAGCDIGMGLTKSKIEGNESEDIKKDEKRGLGIYPAIGYVATAGNLSVGTFVVFGFGGKDAGNDPMNTMIGIDASVAF